MPIRNDLETVQQNSTYPD